MGNKVYLNIKTDRGVIVIPFVGLEELDFFTVGYSSRGELITSLCKILNLSISMDEVSDVYITGDMYKKSDKGSLSQIKYSGNNFDKDTLMKMFALYLKQDRRRVKRNGIRNVITEGMVKFKGGRFVSDKEIDKAVEVYFKDYKNQRDTYFLIKDFAKVEKEQLSLVSRTANRKELYQLESREDNFFQYLIELASRDREKFEIAMDELSKADLEDIGRALGKNYIGVVDGVSNEELGTPEDIYLLEHCTNMSIYELGDLLFEFRNVDFLGRAK